MSGSGGASGNKTDYQRRQERAAIRSWDGLTKAAVGRRCAERLSIQWAFDHMDVPIEAIDPESVPSSGAVGLLKWARADDVNRSEFFRQIWPKSMPTRSQIDDQSRGNTPDENRSLKELIVSVQVAAQRACGILPTVAGVDGRETAVTGAPASPVVAASPTRAAPAMSLPKPPPVRPPAVSTVSAVSAGPAGSRLAGVA